MLFSSFKVVDGPRRTLSILNLAVTRPKVLLRKCAKSLRPEDRESVFRDGCQENCRSLPTCECTFWSSFLSLTESKENSQLKFRPAQHLLPAFVMCNILQLRGRNCVVHPDIPNPSSGLNPTALTI